MKKVLVGLGILGIIVVGLIFGFKDELSNVTISPAKDFNDLDEVDKHVMQYDSVHGDYLQWTGTQDLGEGIPENNYPQIVI